MTDVERAELNRLRQLEVNEHAESSAGIAEQAWITVRKTQDAAWADLPMEIRHKLEHLAEKYAARRAEAEGDYAPEGFYDAVPKQDRRIGQRRDLVGRKENRDDVTNERRVAKADRRTPIRLVAGHGADLIPPSGGMKGTFTVDREKKSATVNVLSQDIPEQSNPPIEDPTSLDAVAPSPGSKVGKASLETKAPKAKDAK